MRLKGVAVVLLVATALSPAAYLAWSNRDVPHLGYFQDDGLYLIGAKSLAEGSGYRILSLPGQPYQTKYPPLYPLLLSVVWAVAPEFPGNLPWALLASWFWVPLLVGLFAVYFRDSGFSARPVLALCAVLALNPVLAFLGVTLMADVMFSALVLAAAIVAERAGRIGSSPMLAFAAGLLAAAAYLTKTAALPLLITVPALYLWRGRKLAAATFLAAMAPAAVAWSIWARMHTPGSSDPLTLYYTNYLGFYRATISRHDVISLLLTNADTFLRGMGGLAVFQTSEGYWMKLLVRLVALAAIVGNVRLARRHGITHLQFFATVYSALLISWNYTPNERFLLPLLPLIWAGLFTEGISVAAAAGKAFRGCARTRESTDQRAAATVVLAAVAALVIIAAGATWQGFARFLPKLLESHRNTLAENRKAFNWVARNTPADSTFVAYQDTLLYLYAHRTGARMVLSTAPFYHRDADAILRLFKRVPEFGSAHGMTWVLATDQDYDTDLDEARRKVLRREIDTDAGLRREFSSHHGAVYAVANP